MESNMKKLLVIVLAAAIIGVILSNSARTPSPAANARPEATPVPASAPPKIEIPSTGSGELTAPSKVEDVESPTVPKKTEKELEDEMNGDPGDGGGPEAEPAPSSDPVRETSLFSAGMRMEANRLRLKCEHGELTIDGSLLRFTCPSNRKRDFTVNASEVKATIKAGIELESGQKYHFEVVQNKPRQTEQLVCDWLRSIKPAQCYFTQ